MNRTATTLERADVLERVVQLQDMAQKLGHVQQQVLEVGQQSPDASEMAVLQAASLELCAELQAAVADLFAVLEEHTL